MHDVLHKYMFNMHLGIVLVNIKFVFAMLLSLNICKQNIQFGMSFRFNNLTPFEKNKYWA